MCFSNDDTNGSGYIEKHCFVAENLPCQRELFVSVAFSMEINRWHYFLYDLHRCLKDSLIQVQVYHESLTF